MADVIPAFTQRVVTSDAPQSKLSSADIAQPYEFLARALDARGQGLEQLGQGAMQAAIPLAEEAGAKAVTRDADGNIQIERAPIAGAAGFAYARAVKVGAVAQAETSIQRDDIERRQQFQDNPEGYMAASDAYRTKMVQQYTNAGGAEIGQAVGRIVDQNTTQTYRGLQNEKERLDLQRADQAITAQVTSATDDAVALARQGVDLNSPEMQGLLGKYNTLLDEKMSNPKIAYTREQRDLDFAQFQGELAGARNLYHVDQVYQKQGYQPAVDAAKDVLTNPDYKLTPAQRQSFFSHAMGEIRANEAIRHQDIGEVRAGLRELSTSAYLGQRVTPDEVEALRTQAKAANWSAGVAMIDATFAHKDLHDDFGKQPLASQTQELNSIRGAAAAKQAYQFFTGRGYTPEQASGIVGNLVHESGLNPAAVGDSGTSAGLAQFHNERLAALKSYAASVGKPASDFQTQLEFIDRELQTTEAPTRALLQAAKTPEQAAQAFINYERPAGYTPQNPAGGLGYANRQTLARAVYAGQAADGSGGPGVASWLIANRSATVDDAATRSWKQIMDDWSAGKGGGPSQDRVNEVLEAARATNNIDLQAKIARDMDVIDKVQRISQLPVAQQNAVELELRRRLAEGTAAPGAELVEKQLLARTQAIQKGLENDPVSTAIANFPDKFKTPAPLNFQDPQQLIAGLKMRGQIVQVAAANWGSGALSALDSQEVVQTKAALANPDPSVKAGIYGAIATLPEDVRGATLRALGGNEPQGLAQAAAGSLMASDPAIASSIFRGQAAMKADKRYDPTTENEGKRAYFGDLDKALPASAFTLQDRTDPAGAYSTMSAMVRARYADLSAQAGDTNYSQDRLKQSVTDVTGGILTHNGGSLVAPARGMSQAQFDGVIRGVKDQDLQGVTTLSGQPVTASYLRGSARLESVGDGRYFVLLGNDPAKPVYAYQGANGELPSKFVLDLRGRGSAPEPFTVPPNPF